MIPDRRSFENTVIAEHRVAVGRRHHCTYVVGYVDDSDDQKEVFLDPPAVVIVEPQEVASLLHFNGRHLDPYWDVRSNDPRLKNLRSMWTHGHSYDLKTGKRERGPIIQLPLTRWEKLGRWWNQIDEYRQDYLIERSLFWFTFVAVPLAALLLVLFFHK